LLAAKLTTQTIHSQQNFFSNLRNSRQLYFAAMCESACIAFVIQ